MMWRRGEELKSDCLSAGLRSSGNLRKTDRVVTIMNGLPVNLSPHLVAELIA